MQRGWAPAALNAEIGGWKEGRVPRLNPESPQQDQEVGRPSLPAGLLPRAESGVDHPAVGPLSPGGKKGASEWEGQVSGTASYSLSGFVLSLKFRDNPIKLAASRCLKSQTESPQRTCCRLDLCPGAIHSQQISSGEPCAALAPCTHKLFCPEVTAASELRSSVQKSP